MYTLDIYQNTAHQNFFWLGYIDGTVADVRHNKLLN